MYLISQISILFSYLTMYLISHIFLISHNVSFFSRSLSGRRKVTALADEKSELLVGQVPLINDIALSHQSIDDDAKNSQLSGLLWIGDRDERIKCCYYPQCHVIKDFYLGHESYVGALALVDRERFLVSAGGDCYANIWAFHENDNDNDDIRARRKALTAVRHSVPLTAVRHSESLNAVSQSLDSSKSNIFAISSIKTPEATLVLLFDENLPVMHVIRLAGGKNTKREPESQVVELEGLVLSHAIVGGGGDQLVLLLDNGKIKVFQPTLDQDSWISASDLVDSENTDTSTNSIIAALNKRSGHFPDLSFYRARCVSQLRKDFAPGAKKRKLE